MLYYRWIMISSLNNFDPILFLDINTDNMSDKQLVGLHNGLNSKVGEYILLKSAELLTEEQLEEITKAEDQKIVETIQEYIPDIDSKISGWLNEFKDEYTKQLGVI